MKGSLVALSVALSVLGMAFHTVQEFGWGALVAPASGWLPVALVQFALLVSWWRRRTRGRLAALAATGWVQLVGGAVLTVLPLPFLPFSPEQSVGHYVSHLVYGAAQLPLAALPLARGRMRSGRPPRP